MAVYKNIFDSVEILMSQGKGFPLGYESFLEKSVY